MLLRDLLPKTPSPELHMYLRDMWRLCDHTKPKQFFASVPSGPTMRVFRFRVMRCATLPPSSINESQPDLFTKSPDLRSVRPVPPTVPVVSLIGWLLRLSLSLSSSQRPPLLSQVRFWNMFPSRSCLRA
ncbi:hypothetical protein LINGRAHAP2_LOCUS14289 [Linum grandiflorum]